MARKKLSKLYINPHGELCLSFPEHEEFAIDRIDNVSGWAGFGNASILATVGNKLPKEAWIY